MPKLGEKVCIGDRKTSLWTVPESAYYQMGDSDELIWLEKGARLKATYEFRYQLPLIKGRPYWERVKVHLDVILPPRVRWRTRRWRRLINFFRPSKRPPGDDLPRAELRKDESC
jgi:hypothetical protein